MDIVGPPSTADRKQTLVYTHDTRFAYICLYLVAVLLKQATSAKIAEALIEKFINPYTASKTWITNQGLNFISIMIRRIAHKYKISTYKTSAYRL